MSKLPVILSASRVQTLTERQLRAVYEKRLGHWMVVAGFTNPEHYYRKSGGARWGEFRADWLNGKITVLASEVPEIDDLLDPEPGDHSAIELETEDYVVLWLVTHGEMSPVRQMQV